MFLAGRLDMVTSLLSGIVDFVVYAGWFESFYLVLCCVKTDVNDYELTGYSLLR